MKIFIQVILFTVLAIPIFSCQTKVSTNFSELKKHFYIKIKPKKCLWQIKEMGRQRQTIGPNDFQAIIILEATPTEVLQFKKEYKTLQNVSLTKKLFYEETWFPSDIKEIISKIKSNNIETNEVETYFDDGVLNPYYYGNVLIYQNKVILIEIMTK